MHGRVPPPRMTLHSAFTLRSAAWCHCASRPCAAREYSCGVGIACQLSTVVSVFRSDENRWLLYANRSGATPLTVGVARVIGLRALLCTDFLCRSFRV